MNQLNHKDFLPSDQEAVPVLPKACAPQTADAWQVLPLEGDFEFSYSDAAGNPSLRRVAAQELKIGPGKILLGGFDLRTSAYRGFRADRIGLFRDAATGEIVSRNVLDWLLKRAKNQRNAKARKNFSWARTA